MARTRLLDPEEYQKIKLTKRTFFLFPYILIQMVIKLVIIFIILIFKSIIKSIIKFVNVIFRTNPIEYRCKVCGYPVYIRRKIIGGYQAALKKEYDGHCTACGAFYEKFNKKQNRLYNNAISHIAYVDNDGYKRFLPKENFDRAAQDFDFIINRYKASSIGYWNKLLAKLRITYDHSHNYATPICYYLTDINIREENDYKLAMKYADDNLKEKYETEVLKIEKAINDWREKSSKLDYDIFICESPDYIRETKNRINKLYYYLTNNGYKVFYGDISLKGEDTFEPYKLIDAVSKAKIMIFYPTWADYYRGYVIESEMKFSLGYFLEIEDIFSPGYNFKDDIKDDIRLYRNPRNCIESTWTFPLYSYVVDSKDLYDNILSLIMQKCLPDENLVVANYKNKIANIDFTDIVSAIAKLNNIKNELLKFSRNS